MHRTGIMKALEKAVERLVKDDVFLLKYDVHEQAISHRIAVYLESLFSEYNVDCEYNNDLDSESGRKQVQYSDNSEKSSVRPDVIVHRRGLNGHEHNILVAEIKKLPSTEDELEKDRDRLSEFTSRSNDHHFRYQCGALIKLGVRNSAGFVEIEWFGNWHEYKRHDIRLSAYAICNSLLTGKSTLLGYRENN